MNELWGAIALVLTACTGGYFHLSSRLNKLSDSINTAQDFQKSFVRLVDDVHEIKKALLGTYDKPGLIKKVYDIDKDVKVLKEAQT